MGPTHCDPVVRHFACPVVPMLLGYDPLLQFVHEEDCLEAFEQAMLDAHPGVYNVVAPGALPLSTLLRLAGNARAPLPAPLLYRMRDLAARAQPAIRRRGSTTTCADLGRRRRARLGGLRRTGLHLARGVDLVRLVAPDAALPLGDPAHE